MGVIREISPLEAFFSNGGVMAVLRPIPITTAPTAKEGEATVLSFEAPGARTRARKSASLEAPNLVLAAPNRAAFETVHQRDWPIPVLIDELNLPPYSTEDGWIIREAYATFENAPLRTYLSSSSRVRGALTRWASAANVAIERALRVRMIHRGRVVVCGGEPFVGLIASHLVPARVRHEGAAWINPVLGAFVRERAGFTVNRAGDFTRTYDVKPLYIGPPPVPQQARVVTHLPLPGSKR